MRGRLSLIVAGVSLVLCIGASAIWVRSHFWGETFGWAGWKDQPAGIWHGWGINSEAGLVYAYSFEGTYQFDNPRDVYPSVPNMKPHIVHEAMHASGTHGRKSFRWDNQRYGDKDWYIKLRFIGAPAWFVTWALAVIPGWYSIVVAFPSWRRWRIARREGRCGACLYDLTGNASGVCPECGKAVSLKPATLASGAV